MNKKLSLAVTIAGLILIMIGLLNAVLGIKAIISGTFPKAEKEVLIPVISIGSIVFGLVMLVAGTLWVISGTGYLIYRKWARLLALYVSSIIVAINLAGALKIWGFTIGIGWAVFSTVIGIGAIWYLSKKDLASFFIISVLEHTIIIVIFAMLIYSEPIEIAEPSDEVVVTIEEMKLPEPQLVKTKPRPKKVVSEKLPELPKIEIKSVKVAEPGAEIEYPAPKIPKTLAQFADKGSDTVFRSPSPKERERQYLDEMPKLGVAAVPDGSVKPVLEVGTSEGVRKGTSPKAARESTNVRSRESSTVTERPGPSAEVARPGFVGDITGEVAGRRVVYWPKQPEEYKGTEGGSATIKFWVDPAGNVIRVELSRKSGSPSLDRIAKEFVEQIRFAELPRNFQQKVQWGEIPINFELTGKAG